MKSFKKYLIIFAVLVALGLLILPNILSSRYDYAKLVIGDKYNNYIILNDSQKYCYMPYYRYNSDPDSKILNADSVVTSFFNPCFWGYSNDTEKNFLYCTRGGFGVQTVGLYVNEFALDDFNASLNNIYRIVIYDENDTEQLVVNSCDEKFLNLFIEYYSSEINDCFFPKNETDEKLFNGKYEIYIEYSNGTVSRFFRCIDVTEFEMWARYIT